MMTFDRVSSTVLRN